MIQLYFPAPILLQYTDKASDAKELRELAEEDAIQLYLDFMANTESDCRTSIYLPSPLLEQFFRLRNAFYNLMLGRDVCLYFSKDFPMIVDYDAEDLSYYIKQLETVAPKLKLKKMSRIERILLTDLVFRLYYNVYDKIKDLLPKYRETKEKVRWFTYEKGLRYTAILTTYTPYHRRRPSETRELKVTFPEPLKGFMASCFPLLTTSGVIQLSLLNFFASGRWREVSEELKNLKGYGLGGNDSAEEFVADCKAQLELHLENYIGHLQRFINAVETIGSEEDPITHFIISHLPTTVLDLIIEADGLGYSPKIIASRIKSMLALGRLVMEGEVLNLRK